MLSFGRRRIAMGKLQKIFPYSVWFQSHVDKMVSGGFSLLRVFLHRSGFVLYVQKVYPSSIRFRMAEQIRYGGSAPLRQSESRSANARNVNFTNSLRWPIFISARLTKPNYLFIKIYTVNWSLPDFQWSLRFSTYHGLWRTLLFGCHSCGQPL